MTREREGSAAAAFGWMPGPSTVLGLFLPTTGPFAAGLVGGARVGRVKNGLLAALWPAILLGTIVGLPSALLTGLPVVGAVFSLSVATVVAMNILGLLARALLGAPIFGRSDSDWLGEPSVQAGKKGWR
jgi:hypothetical protein